MIKTFSYEDSCKGACVEKCRLPLIVRCILNVCAQALELDKGSSVSILTEGMVLNVRSAKVSKMYQKAKDAGNNVIKFIDETTQNVEIKNLIK